MNVSREHSFVELELSYSGVLWSSPAVLNAPVSPVIYSKCVLCKTTHLHPLVLKFDESTYHHKLNLVCLFFT